MQLLRVADMFYWDCCLYVCLSIDHIEDNFGIKVLELTLQSVFSGYILWPFYNTDIFVTTLEYDAAWCRNLYPIFVCRW